MKTGTVELRVEGPIAHLLLNQPKSAMRSIGTCGWNWCTRRDILQRHQHSSRGAFRGRRALQRWNGSVDGESCRSTIGPSANQQRSRCREKPGKRPQKLHSSPRRSPDSKSRSHRRSLCWRWNEVALGCDILIAAEDAPVALNEVRAGMVPDLGGTARVTRRCGTGHACDLILTARRIGSKEAQPWGLVQRLCEPGRAQHRLRSGT